ncbi:MAG: SDR family oxidoreductase [Chloroflexi bacterium]|nr:SDR family oxidoreductase [Chloroflexota bacterium]
MDLRGKVALITGGGTGAGRAIALALADAGVDVAVNYSRSADAAAATVRDLESRGRRAVSVQADVSVAAQVQRMVAETVEALGRIDILVNNAGFTKFVAFQDLEGIDEATWDQTMAVNAKAPWLCAKAVAPIMKRQGAGRIVNTASTAGLRPGGSSLAYSVSKAALIQLTRGLALALAPEITVNAVAPGILLTRWSEGFTPEAMERNRNETALKRFATVEEVADAVVLFARSGSVTGQTLVLDGGRVMH